MVSDHTGEPSPDRRAILCSRYKRAEVALDIDSTRSPFREERSSRVRLHSFRMPVTTS